MLKNKLIRKAVVVLLFVCFGAKAFASDVEYIHPFKLNPVNDGILLGAGVALSGSALVCDKFLNIKASDFNSADLLKEDVPTFDQIFMRPYSKALHIVGTGTLAVSLVSPIMFAALPSTEWLNAGLIYGETLLIANGIKEWIKIAVNRPRPYMYYDGYPEDKVDDGDWNCSFPSGHSTMAFTSAAFVSYLFNLYYPDSNWRFVVTGASFGLAALTAGLRMASGNHFFTDVLTGAVIGTVCGFAIPYMHTELFYKKFQKNKNVDMSVSPMGFNFQVKF